MLGSTLLIGLLASAGLAAPIEEAKRVHLPEEGMRAKELIEYYGYPAEYHNVTTSDGYILTMVRIPHGKTNAYILADLGYDVYMGNMRGNSYSLLHEKYTVKDQAFWDFSWQDMAAKDLPAIVEAALALNGKFSRVVYVGHSQGTLIGFTHFSAETAWTAQHIEYFFALAPVYYLKGITSPLKLIAPFAKDIYRVYELIGGAGDNKFLSKYITPICGDDWIYDYICKPLEFYILGTEIATNINQTRIPIYFGGNQGGTSMKNYLAFAEGVNSGECQQFAYNTELSNHDHYNCWQFMDYPNCPPQFHAQNMAVKTHIFWSDADALADPTDAFRLIELIPEKVREQTLLNGYSHVDFLWGTHVVEQIYDKMITTIATLDFGKK